MDSEKPKATQSSKIWTWYANVLFHFSEAVHTARRESVPRYRPKVVSRRSHRKNPICKWRHSYSISPCQTLFSKNKYELCNDYKAVDCHRTSNCVHTGTRCPLLCPSTSSRPCTLAPAPCSNSNVGILKKRVCLYFSARRVAYLATVSGHQVWRLPYFSACNKGNRTRLPARRLFVPLMSNSAFNKTE